MRTETWIVSALGALAVCSAANAASAAPAKPSSDAPDYGRDVISVTRSGRHATFPTANCVVWVNAEGLGVGRAQLGGFHGLTMNLNTQPLPNESATPFAAGLAEVKARFPGAPAWLFGVLEKNRSAIEAACLQDHETPQTVYSVTRRDVAG